MNDRGKYIWLKPLKALFICWSTVDILSFCSLRSAGNNHCNNNSVILYRETNEDGKHIDFYSNFFKKKSLYWLEFEQNLDFNSHSSNVFSTLIVTLIYFQGGRVWVACYGCELRPAFHVNLSHLLFWPKWLWNIFPQGSKRKLFFTLLMAVICIYWIWKENWKLLQTDKLCKSNFNFDLWYWK